MSKTMSTARRRPRRVLLTALAAGATVALALSACSGSGAAAGQNALERIKQRGTINVGSCLQTPPFGMVSKSGTPEGFDVDVAKQLGKYLGVKVNDTDVSADARVPSLQSGKLDVVSCTFTITPERQKQVGFSDPVMRSGGLMAVKKGSGIDGVEDLAGKTIAVDKGGIGSTLAKQAAPDAKQQQYDSFSAAVLAVQQGQADAMIDTSGPMTYAVSTHDGLEIAGGEIGDVASFGLGVRKGEPELTKRINAFLEEFHAKGEGTKLYEKWLGTKPTFDFDGLE